MEDEIPLSGKRAALRITYVRNQDALVDLVQSEEDLAQFPYGLMLWASAIGLADALANDPVVKKAAYGKRVLEIGCGVGVAGIAARIFAGAASVVQTDYQTDTLLVAAHNARANNANTVTQILGDWRDFPNGLGTFDLVIGSDVLYERSLHTTLAQLLPRLVSSGGEILLADPLRPQALEWLEAQEKSGRWNVQITGWKTTWDGENRDLGLFWLRPR